MSMFGQLTAHLCPGKPKTYFSTSQITLISLVDMLYPSHPHNLLPNPWKPQPNHLVLQLLNQWKQVNLPYIPQHIKVLFLKDLALDHSNRLPHHHHPQPVPFDLAQPLLPIDTEALPKGNIL